MPLKPEVSSAFATLGLPEDADEPTASRAYKKLALLHHPDRNHGATAGATRRFQEVRLFLSFLALFRGLSSVSYASRLVWHGR